MGRPFTDVIRDVNAGVFAEECTRKLTELVAEIRRTGGTGTISVSLKLTPQRGGDVMQIEHDVKLKLPKPESPRDFFWTDKGNSLVTKNPAQSELPFREVVDRDTGEIHVVPAPAANAAEGG